MFGKSVLCLWTIHFYSVAAQGECVDLRGRHISHGLHYVPGPDTCTLCVCDNGLPKVCKAVLCSPPQDCRSFRVGNTCCEFICLDDVVKPADSSDANLRMAAAGAALILLFTLALVTYRFSKQKTGRPMHGDDQRSLTSIGYISGSMGYMGGTCETALSSWKPPGNYLPRGEAPPPYDEVIAQCRQDMRVSEVMFHRTYPVTVEALSREEQLQYSAHQYANMQRHVPQMQANPQSCLTAPLLEPAPIMHNPMGGLGYSVRLTGSLGAISGRCTSAAPPERPRHVPGFYTNSHTTLHRTIPRLAAGTEPGLVIRPGGAEGRGLQGDVRGLQGEGRGLQGEGRVLMAEGRRSFHRVQESRSPAPVASRGRSMPRNLNIASTEDIHVLEAEDSALRSNSSRTQSEELNIGAEPILADSRQAESKPAECRQAEPRQADCKQAELQQAEAKPVKPGAEPVQPTLPLTVDQPLCVCSYSSLAGVGVGGEGVGGGGEVEARGGDDDYRNECENCKAATSSRWVVSESWERAESMTLQRRPPPAAPAPPAHHTHTLPAPTTKHTRTLMGPPSNWENWFNTIPDSDTESEE